MKKIYLISAIAALLCGFLVFRYVGNVNAEMDKIRKAQEPELTTVVVAKSDIPPFTEITQDMVQLRKSPAAYTDENAARQIADVLGKEANGTIVKGETIMLTAIGSLNEIGDTLAYAIPDGMRAMTIDVSAASGVGGYVTQGDTVDILLYATTEKDDSITPTGETKRPVPGGYATVVTENATVLRVGNSNYDSEGLYSSLTLALLPEDCARLLAAMNQGSLYAVLRQMSDESKTDTAIHSATELLN